MARYLNRNGSVIMGTLTINHGTPARSAVEGDRYLNTNRHARPLVSYLDLPESARADFDYMVPEVEVPRYTFAENRGGEWSAWEGEQGNPRFFSYRGAWYDAQEFERAGDDVKALGFDAVQGQSYFDAVLLTYWDREGNELEDSVIVGHLHW